MDAIEQFRARIDALLEDANTSVRIMKATVEDHQRNGNRRTRRLWNAKSIARHFDWPKIEESYRRAIQMIVTDELQGFDSEAGTLEAVQDEAEERLAAIFR